MEILLIRPEGPYRRTAIGNDTFITQTSLPLIAEKDWQLEEIAGMTLGTVILEDLHVGDIEGPVRDAILAGSAGRSCPIVSRWTALRQGDAR